jgi:hypothetical protein
LLSFRRKKLRHYPTDLGNANNSFHPMFAEAESDITTQHLLLCCLWRVANCTASSPLSPKILFFFKRCQYALFFLKDYWLLSSSSTGWYSLLNLRNNMLLSIKLHLTSKTHLLNNWRVVRCPRICFNTRYFF